MTLEYRQINGDDSEIRSEGEGMSFTGYTSRYNSPSLPLPFIETVEPGAWERTLKAKNEVKSFINHNTDLVLGSTRSGTLRLQDDERGLLTHIDLPETTYGRDLAYSTKRGDVSSMSVGMSVVKDEWSSDYTKRRIIEARLHEVSVVTGFAAFSETTATVRALPMIALRTGVALDALADAMTTLESGAELSEDQKNVLMETIDRSSAKAAVEPEPLELTTPLSLLRKQLDLKAKGF
jgi:HK97 family phage prohead protease